MLGHEGKEDWTIDEDKRAAKILDEAKQWLVDQQGFFLSLEELVDLSGYVGYDILEILACRSELGHVEEI
ncbi:hypothetical protein I3760_05G002900 [Carya illinoinensis]|nr:hypothetical protein I3760_05G002900 [Carya illinoinensis]